MISLVLNIPLYNNTEETTLDAEIPPVAPAEPPAHCTNHHQYLKTIANMEPRHLGFQEIFDAGEWPYTYTDLGVTGHFLNVTTTYYLTEDDTTADVWWSRVLVFVPNNLDGEISNKIYLTNRDGDNRDADGHAKAYDELKISPNHADNYKLAALAAKSGTVSAVQWDNPNQGLKYFEAAANSNSFVPNGYRTEDFITAYSWRHYATALGQGNFNPNQINWVLQVPMAISTIKTFNAIQDFLADTESLTVDSYAVAGISKRGNNAWLVGALDSRVFAIIPTAYDLLDVKNTLKEAYFRSLGAWSYAFFPYYTEGATLMLDTPAVDFLACIVDPLTFQYEYKNRNIPIFHTGGSSDQFFLIQGNNAWIDGFRTELDNNFWIRYLYNVDHYIQLKEGTDGQHDTLRANRIFYVNAAKGNIDNVPKLSWSRSYTNNGDAGVIEVSIPSEYTVTLRVFAADTLLAYDITGGKRQDFRGAYMQPNGQPGDKPVLWNNPALISLAEIEDFGNNNFRVTMPRRTDGGYRAFYLDLEIEMADGGKFSSADENTINFSTPAVVIPEGFALDTCHGADCEQGLMLLA